MNFSIILPTYNNLELAKQAISSVLMQRDCSFELIVVDDSSTTIIEQFIKGRNDDHIKYHHNISPLGAVKNWNYGLSLATGQYIILLHHDERISNESHLKKINEQMSLGYEIVIAPVIVYIGNNIHTNIFQNKRIRKYMIRHPKLLFCANAIGPTACVCFKRNCALAFHEKLHWLVDVEWYYELLKGRNTSLLDNTYTIISKHGHDDQITNHINIRKALYDDVKEIKKIHVNNILINIALIMNKLILQLHKIAKK